MELIYVWIEKFHNIQKKGFSFSPRFNVDFYDGEIKINLTNQPAPAVFPPHITNITALVGKNGSGKSSILELIGEKELNRRRYKEKDDAWFILYWIKDDFYVLEEMFSDISKDRACPSLIKNAEPPNGTYNGLHNPSSIYYQYSVQEQKLHFIDFLQVPKKGALQEAIQFYTPLCPGSKYTTESLRKNHATSQFYRHLFSEFELGLSLKYRFLIESRSKSKRASNKYDLNYSNVTLIIQVQKIGFDICQKYNFDEKIRKIDDFSFACGEEVKHKSQEDRGIISLAGGKKNLSSKANCIICFLENTIKYFSSKFLDGKIPKVSEQDDYRNYLRIVLEKICVRVEEKISSEFEMFFIRQPVIMFFDILENIENHYFGEDKICFLRPGDKFDRSAMKLFKFLDSIHSSQATSESLSCFSFAFAPLSDGEKQFLHLTSSMFSAIQNMRFRGLQHAILILDEPDNSLHPETARQFISYLVSELTRFNRITFQIILATHSPLLLSDIPSHSVILLEKKLDDGACVVKKNKIETFASNIHTLLAEDFFMKCTIGGWAEKYIKEILSEIQSISDDGITEAQYHQIEKQISIIGEDVIRYRLEQKLKNTLSNKKASKKIRIHLLEEEIKKLKTEVDNEIY